MPLTNATGAASGVSPRPCASCRGHGEAHTGPWSRCAREPRAQRLRTPRGAQALSSFPTSGAVLPVSQTPELSTSFGTGARARGGAARTVPEGAALSVFLAETHASFLEGKREPAASRPARRQVPVGLRRFRGHREGRTRSRTCAPRALGPSPGASLLARLPQLNPVPHGASSALGPEGPMSKVTVVGTCFSKVQVPESLPTEPRGRPGSEGGDSSAGRGGQSPLFPGNAQVSRGV